MPKKVYTLGDIKEMIAEKESVSPGEVKDRCCLQGMFVGEAGWETVENDSEIFEINVE